MSSSDERTTDTEERYQKLSHRDHVMVRPDTYIGSVQPHTEKQWIVEDGKFIRSEVTYVPGLYKIFDEILVNAADNKQRDPPMKTIKVNIDIEEGMISVWNDGKGIPIQQQHDDVDDVDVWIPEFIFGHLLTSSNYDDTKKKVTGGRNGFGAKLANIFSTKFIVEAFNEPDKKIYIQEFSDNMGVIGTPQIRASTRSDKRSYTKITFYPDFQKFGMNSFKDNDTHKLMARRVYDLCGILGGVSVHFNDDSNPLPIRGWAEYCRQFVDDPTQLIIYEDKKNPRWRIAVAPSKSGEFRQVSFCNAVATTKGGTHVKYISDQVEEYFVNSLANGKPKITVKPVQVRRCLTVFVCALIENPTFDSQTKDSLTLTAKNFGSECVLPDSFLKKLKDTNISVLIREVHRNAEKSQLNKLKGTKVGRIHVPKLEDANEAGRRGSKNCTLILTEGDSAKTMAVTGLSIIGRDYYGVFPLRGKLLNTRDISAEKLAQNEEIQHILTIMGLDINRTYEDGTDSLRYGRIMIMTDQDQDGSHIKGLIINFIHSMWPALFKNNDFLCEFVTPIVKVSKQKRVKEFFTIPEFIQWKQTTPDSKSFYVKYYKGLATSDTSESRQYFKNFKRHKIDFKFEGNEDEHAIELAFSKKRADDRKKWLANLDLETTYLGQDTDSITYSDFVDRELILFSHYANVRSIPSVMDGLKPGQRKILWVALKNNITREIKVAQLSGKVSEQSAYHHGEESLNQTIIGMAQDYIGSNNINLLEPRGFFGSRLNGGKDAGSPRYIYTNLSPITRTIFHKEDDQLLHYLTDEGKIIEPKFYAPILPMVLVNGSEGIGVGWSSTIPCFSPADIVRNLRHLIKEEELEEIHPWYSGFTGDITKLPSGRWQVKGKVEIVDDTTIRISELPVLVWTYDYKVFLESMLSGDGPDKVKSAAAKKKAETKAKAAKGTKGKAKAAPAKKSRSKKVDDEDPEKASQPKISDLREYNSDNSVDFEVTVTPEQMAEIETVGLEKFFNITTTISQSNFTLFDPEGKIKQYPNANEIIKDFFRVRIGLYEERRVAMIADHNRDFKRLSNQARFIKEVMEGVMIIQRRPLADILKNLKTSGYDLVEKQSANKPKKVSADAIETEEPNPDEEEIITEGELGALQKGYDYLLSMKMYSMTLEKYNKLVKETEEIAQKISILEATAPQDMWLEDLEQFEEEWKKFEEKKTSSRSDSLKDVEKTKRISKKNAPKRPAPKKKPVVKKEASTASNSQDIIEEASKVMPKATKTLKPKAEPKVKTEEKPKAAAKAKPKARGGKKGKSAFEVSDDEDIEIEDDIADVEEPTRGIAGNRTSRRAAPAKIDFKKAFAVSESSEESLSEDESESSEGFEDDE